MLYNGIELPAGWPPNRVAADVQSYEPMRVPYLEQPPAVIPIDVGRQLFVDDFLIATTTLERRFHQAEPYAKNPILRPEKRWEVFLSNRGAPKSAMAFSDGCFYDPQDKVFKLWYRHGVHGGTCYTTSQDGINWQRPSLDVRPPTNVVLIAGHRDATTIWLDHDAKDPSQRFKLFQFHRDVWRGSVHTSPDGIHWSEPTWCGTTGDRNSIFYNPFRKVWVYSIRAQANHPPWNYKTTPMRQALRARKYWETPDLLAGANWKGSAKDHDDWPADSPQFWFGADKLDPHGPSGRRAELYNLDAAPYESVSYERNRLV